MFLIEVVYNVIVGGLNDMAKKAWVFTAKRREALFKKAQPKHSLLVRLGKEVYDKRHGNS